MRAAKAARRARATALVAVVALHLLGGLLFMRALRDSRRTEPAYPLTVWLAWSGSRNPLAVRQSKAAPGNSRTHRPELTGQNTAPPTAAIATSPGVDWGGELRAAAANSIERASRERRRNSSMGSTPRSPYRTMPTRPAFPWSHQALGKHYDFDSSTGLLTIRGKRCVLAIWLIVPGFACAAGPEDPEPGEGDLFDRKYGPWELELPKSLQEAQQTPQ
ncbi:MAG TPA: hypothetical protein VK130_01900 [Steroidobacteraceae bacterium]|nr:hypothetical protein [Steroidobacteraceae bacterium]